MTFNISSPQQLSLLLFGGKVKSKRRVLVGKYKNGNDKYELQTVITEVKGLGLKPHKDWKGAKDGIYSTGENVLKLISKKENTDAGKITALMLEIRGLEKELLQYYEGKKKGKITGFKPYIHEHDGCIHPQLSHCGYEKADYTTGGGVNTGRLSGTAPNPLNIPKPHESPVRRHFTSRFKETGCICEADFSQIEIAVQAGLSKDPNYIQDIKDGVDFHCKRLAFKEKLDYNTVYKYCKIDCLPEWDEKRSKVKAFSFQRAYGAGVKKLAADNGMTEDEIKDLIKADDIAYPVLKDFNDNLKQIVNAHGQYQSILGRIFKFNKYPAPKFLQDKGILESYKPTQIVNYPIQGTATGDISMIMIGVFWRQKAIYNRDKYLMILTVYDSLDLDCKIEHKEQLKKDLKILEKVDVMLHNYFRLDWNVPIKIDIKFGDSWGTCK